MQTISTDAELNVPKEIAVCPYCETALTITFDSWTQNDDGTWSADHCSMDCESEPPMNDADAWEDWIQQHSEMPYLYLLPVHQKVLKWVNANYRFDLSADKPIEQKGT